MKTLLSHSEVARKGGLTIKKKYGKNHFSILGKRSAAARKRRKRSALKIRSKKND